MIGQILGGGAAMLFQVETITSALVVGMISQRYRNFLALALIAGIALALYRSHMSEQNRLLLQLPTSTGRASMVFFLQFLAFFLAAHLASLTRLFLFGLTRQSDD
jgi:uncharacterized protein HemY